MEQHIHFVQDHMGDNVCFGCGIHNPDGLQIKSFWDGEECVCDWTSQEKYHGWRGLMNGGILATLVDCHCMAMASAHAYKLEGRELGSEPRYGYATGTLTLKYLKPTSNDAPVQLRATVLEVKGKKTTMRCEVWSEGVMTVEAEVIGIRVLDSSQVSETSVFKG